MILTAKLEAAPSKGQSKLPPPKGKQADVIRISAGALLVAEAKARRDLQRTMKLHSLEASENAREQQRGDGTVELATLGAILLLHSRRMSAALAERLQLAKHHAREVGAARLKTELRAAGGQKLLWRIPAIQQRHEDAQAIMAADSLSVQWRTRALQNAMQKQRLAASEDEAAGVAAEEVYGAAVATSRSVDRTAATEVARAFNEGHSEAAVGLQDLDEEDLAGFQGSGISGELDGYPGVTVMDRWSAILDGRTCMECAALDDTYTLVGEPFPSGYEPGWHPWCRCIRVLEFVTDPVPLREIT